MTAKEAVGTAINILQNIRVPVGLKKEVTDPMDVAIQYLDECMKAWARDEKKAQEDQPDAEETGGNDDDGQDIEGENV